MSSSGQIVLVTGATSFIGSHVINLLLQEGWQVRGTVRSLTSEKTKGLEQVFQEYGKKLELVQCDLMVEKGWDVACKGVTYVMHLACPVDAEAFAKDPMNRVLKDPPDVAKAIKTVVDGTNFVLNAVKAAGVKRMVMTSSIAAMIPKGWCETFFPINYNLKDTYDPEAYLKTITDETWTTEAVVDGYILAKTRSEREAWKALEGSAVELVCVNPGYVFGPQLHKLIACDSTMFIDVAMCQPPGNPKALPAMPSMKFVCVDVRDAAKAHVKAMLLPEAAGQRYLVATTVMSAWNIQDICTDSFKPMGYGTLGWKLPKCLVGLLGPCTCDNLMRRIYMNWEKYPKIDNSKFRRDLIPELVDMKKSIQDTVFASVKTGRYTLAAGFKSEQAEYQGKVGHISLKATL